MKYIVLIYNKDEIVENKKFDTLEEAAKYGEEQSKAGSADGDAYWFKVKAD